MQNTVIYHSADFDGLFCREIARKFLPPDTKFVGWTHGDPPIPFPDEGTVYVMDLSPECFTLTPDDLPMRADGGFDGNFVWIDHHKSALDVWPKNIPGYRIDGVAACRLAWQWLNKGPYRECLNKDRYGLAMEMSAWTFPTKQDFLDRKVQEPLAVRLAGEYDVAGPNANEEALEFQFGLRSMELTPSDWACLLDPVCFEFIQVIKVRGQGVIGYQAQIDKLTVKIAFTAHMDGGSWLAVNAPRANSKAMQEACKPEHCGIISFNWRGDKWVVSLYRSPLLPESDMSAVAVIHGGGGHPGAAGFRCKTLPFQF